MNDTTRLGLITGWNSSPGQGIDLEPVDIEVDTPSVGDAEGASRVVTVLVGERVALLPRHGHRTHVSAHEIDHGANLRALLAVGVDRVVALGSSGALRADWPVGTIVMPDDLFAPWSNPVWFNDARSHISPSFDAGWRRDVRAAWEASTDSPIIDGGTYVQTRGPRFETRAEVRFYASVADIVGMTLADEALLAQQAGLRYAAICPVDNIANGLEVDPLTFDSFRTGVDDNAEHLAATMKAMIEILTR